MCWLRRVDMGSQGHLLLVSFHEGSSQIVVAYQEQTEKGNVTHLLLLQLAKGTLVIQGRAQRHNLTTCIRALPLQPDTFITGTVGH